MPRLTSRRRRLAVKARIVGRRRTNGELIRRLVSHGPLHSPWGLTRASNGSGKFAGAILVGIQDESWGLLGKITVVRGRP